MELELGCRCRKELGIKLSVYFLGWWITIGFVGAPLSWVGIGLSWKDCTASFGKSAFPFCGAPETTDTALFGGLVDTFSASSSGGGTGVSVFLSFKCDLFWVILIPPTFTAVGWLTPSPLSGDDILYETCFTEKAFLITAGKALLNFTFRSLSRLNGFFDLSSSRFQMVCAFEIWERTTMQCAVHDVCSKGQIKCCLWRGCWWWWLMTPRK